MTLGLGSERAVFFFLWSLQRDKFNSAERKWRGNEKQILQRPCLLPARAVCTVAKGTFE